MEAKARFVGKIKATHILMIALLGLVSFGFWIIYATLVNGYAGFPLDDGWIHQTYARNLAEFGQWAYLPGEISGGSTSPLWTALLSLFHEFGLGPFGSAWVLGFLFFIGTLVVGELWARSDEKYDTKIPLAAIFLGLEWHLVWSALSGMETVLYIFLILLFFWLLSKDKKNMFLLGVFVGIVLWVRPDGITLLGPAVFVGFLGQRNGRARILSIAKLVLGFLGIFLPYLLFNRLVAGQWMPNTFYAKQTEYAVLLQTPILQRLASLFLQPLIGAGVFFLPGFLQQVVASIRVRNWVKISAILWCVGFVLIYVFQLPVTYQHGRYLIPMMPVFFIISLHGTFILCDRGIGGKSWQRIVALSGILSAILILLAFWGKGFQAYQSDTAVIHEEMVVPSLWIRDHTESDALIAAHDIGALGYYGEREIIDLAGLISPEIIPIMRDETALLNFLQEKDVDYLMTFPDWYRSLPGYGTLVFQSEGNTAPMLGNTNMAVYQFNFK